MTGRNFVRGPLLLSAGIVLCCAASRAEEGPFLPGLDALPSSPAYTSDPAAADAAPSTRRSLRPSTVRPDTGRGNTPSNDSADQPARRGDPAPGVRAPSVNRQGNRGIGQGTSDDRQPLSRDAARPEPGRAEVLRRAQDAERNAARKTAEAQTMRRGSNDSHPLPRPAIGDRRESLADPRAAQRDQTDPRDRANVEREKAWRGAQNAAAGARDPRTLPAAAPRTPRASKQPGKAAPASPRTGQPNGNRLAR